MLGDAAELVEANGEDNGRHPLDGNPGGPGNAEGKEDEVSLGGVGVDGLLEGRIEGGVPGVGVQGESGAGEGSTR